MIKKLVSVLICAISLILVSCTKDDDDYKTFVFKTIDLVTNKPIENVQIRLGMEIGCSKLLDFKEVFTNKDGNAEIDLIVNQDTIDAFYQAFPSGQRYLNNSIEIMKQNYAVNQFNQDTGIAYIFRPVFAENNLITTYMYQTVPFSIDFKNTKTNLSDKFIDVIINCYPRHPLLDSKVPEYKGKFILDFESKDFVFQGQLAAIPYDIQIKIIEKKADISEDIIVYNQILPLTVDQNNTSNNIIQIDY
jgi:5-hydroxyisourate hydrolase-like protein (transthyretin family)